MSARIGLFGGTFDPVHKGHKSIADAFLNSGFIDELWVLLTPFPPHKENGNQASYENRLQMLKSAFSGTPNLSISTVENELPKPSFSVVTIRHLKEKYPGRTFYYCMGEDNLAHFNQWKFYNEILIECELLVAKRPGADHSQVEQKILERTHFAEHTPLEVSSSQIKEKLQKGESIQECVPEGVLEIIQKERLYL